MITDNLIAYDTETSGLDTERDYPFLHIITDRDQTLLFMEDEKRYWEEYNSLESKITELEEQIATEHADEDANSTQFRGRLTRLNYRKNRLQKLVDHRPNFNMSELRDILEDPNIPKVAHNMVFDACMARQVGITLAGDLYDTVPGLHLLNENAPKNLAWGSQKYCANYKQADPINEWFADRKIKKADKNYLDLPLDIVLPYGGQDGVVTLELFWRLKPLLESSGVWDLYLQECALIPILIKAKRRGFKVNLDYFRKIRPDFVNQIEEAKQEIFRLAGREFNIASPVQLADFLMSQGVVLPTTQKSTKLKPRYSTKKEVLQTIDHPAIDSIMAYRKKAKILSTFIDAVLTKNKDATVHASLNSCGTKSGRFSSNNPNMQNLPKRDPIIRNGFIARPGYVNLYPDYKQMEYRIFADYIRDPWLTDQLMQGADFHDITAAQIKAIGGDRKKAKDINFGLLYGMGATTLAGKLKVSEAEAKDIMRDYFGRFPTAEEFIQRVKLTVRLRGYLVNRFGRRYHLTAKQAYMGVNRLCQGTGADIVKYTMIKVDEAISKYEAQIIMMEHDEIIVEVKAEQAHEVVPPIKTAMETMPPGLFTIPFPIDMEGSATSWSEAKEWK